MANTEGSVVRFYARSAVQMIATMARRFIRRDKEYRVGSYSMTLPPAHRLPWFQSVFPDYDRYFVPLLVDACAGAERPVLIDVGANVGDTALRAISAVPGIRVVAVEGDPGFLRYLRKNLAQVQGQVEVLPSFVADGSAGLEYRSDGSTGRLTRSSASGIQPHVPSVTPREVLSNVGTSDFVIWKSDTDGLDVGILLSAWADIDTRCDVVWFELDPLRDVDEGARFPELWRAIADSRRECRIYDNHGRFMLCAAGDAAASALESLTRWAATGPRIGRPEYFDIWASRP